MKRFLTLTIASMLLASTAFAGAKFGAEFGYDHNWLANSTNYKKSNPATGVVDENVTNKAVLNLDGFHVGPVVLYSFDEVKGLFVGGGIMYQYATGNVKKGDVPALVFRNDNKVMLEVEQCDKINYTMHNLNIPLRVGYKYQFDNGVGVFAYVGPVFNVALDWKLSAEKGDALYTLHQVSGKFIKEEGGQKIQIKDDDYKSLNAYKVFDISLGGVIGMDYKFFYANIGCDWGLLNRSKRPSYTSYDNDIRTDCSNKSRVTTLNITIGVKF